MPDSRLLPSRVGQPNNAPPPGGDIEEDDMSKPAWYLVGLVLLAAACNPVLESANPPYIPSGNQLGNVGQDDPLARPQPHGKKDLDQKKRDPR